MSALAHERASSGEWPLEDFIDCARRYCRRMLRGSLREFLDDVTQEFLVAALTAMRGGSSRRNKPVPLGHLNFRKTFLKAFDTVRRHQFRHFARTEQPTLDAAGLESWEVTREHVLDFFAENAVDTYGMNSNADRNVKRYRVIVNGSCECVMSGREIEECLLIGKSARADAMRRPTERVLHEGKVYRSHWALVKAGILPVKDFRENRLVGDLITISLVELA